MEHRHPRRPSTTGFSGHLLRLYESARDRDLAGFELDAARALGRILGSDGAVWGCGTTGGSDQPLAITHATVADRPAELLADYAGVAGDDPITANFLATPEQLQSAAVADTYSAPAHAGLQDYLRHYRIAHLMLQGRRGGDGAGLAWFTAYREDARRGFGADECALFAALLPHWLQARELCASLQLGRVARPTGGEGHGLCDPGGLLHAVDHDFSRLTGLASGDRLPPRLHAGLLDGGELHCGQLRLCASNCGAWLVVRSSHAPAPPLPGRLAEVALQYARGASHKEIARRLGRSPATIRTQLQTIFARMQVHSRHELMERLQARPATAHPAEEVRPEHMA